MINEKQYINNLGKLLFKKSGLTINCIEETFNLKISNDQSKKITKNFDSFILESKRKNTGSFYTPDYIAKYMVSKALFEYFKNNTSLSDQRLASIFYSRKYKLNKNEKDIILNVFKDLTVADLSCGGGIFLINYIKLVKEILLVNNFDESRKFLKEISKNVHAYDINALAIKSLLLELNIYFEPKSREEIILINTHNLDVISSKNFDESIPESGYDIVIGNPPYLGEKGNKKLFNNIKKSRFGQRYYEGKMDLFYYFIYRGINVMNTSGVLIYLTTNYFITADGAKKLRNFLKDNGHFIEIINFNEYNIFEDARGQHNLIFTYRKNKDENTKMLLRTIEEKRVVNNFEAFINLIDSCTNKCFIDEEFLFNERNEIQLYINENHFSIIKKIKNQSDYQLMDFFNVNQGLVSGADRVSKYNYNKKLSQGCIDLYNINIGDPIYVMNKEKSSIFQEKNYVKHFYKNSDINKFSVNENTNKRILYIDQSVELDELLKSHLLPYKEILQERREVRTGSRKWFEIQWARDKNIFEQEKIVVPQRSRSNIFAYSSESFYGSADIYYITSKKLLLKFPLFALLGLLNSKLFYLYLSNIGKKKGNMLELYATPLKHLLIKKLNQEEAIIEVSKRLSKAFSNELFDKLNQLIYLDYHISDKEIDFIENFYNNRH